MSFREAQQAIPFLSILLLMACCILPACPPCTPARYVLSVAIEGQGEVSKTPEEAAYSHGAQVSLTAYAAAGWRFDRWTGDVASQTNPLTITMASNTGVTAWFIEEEPLDTDYPLFETEVLFDNTGLGSPLETGGAINPAFILDDAAFFATLTVWHTGTLEQTPEIALTGPDGETLGPWPANRLEEAPEGVSIWQVILDMPALPGQYEIQNSEIDTWLHNAGSSGTGFSILTGLMNNEETSALIGASGGEVRLGDVVLSIPPGGLEQDEAVYLSEILFSVPGETLRGIVVSGEGASPLGAVLRFPTPAVMSSEEPWFPLYLPSEAPSDGVTHLGCTLVPGEVSADAIDIPIPFLGQEEAFKANGLTMRNYLYLIVLYDVPRVETSHFILGFGKIDSLIRSIGQEERDLLGYLEDALAHLTTNTGLEFKASPRFPIPVVVSSWLSDEAYANRALGSFRQNDYLQFRRAELLGDPDQTKARAIHELFHLLQYEYIGSRYKSEVALGQNLFFYDMSSTWSEFAFLGGTFWPVQIDINAGLFLINGLFNANNTVAINDSGARAKQAHGYAASTFLRYLAPQGIATGNIVGNIWQTLSTGQTDLKEAWDNNLYVNWRDRLITFAQELYAGHLNAWAPSFLTVKPVNRYLRKNQPRLLGYSNTWEVPDSVTSTSGHRFTAPMAGYSARPFQIRVTGNWPDLDTKIQIWTENMPSVYLHASIFEGNDEQAPVNAISASYLTQAEPEQIAEGMLAGNNAPFTIIITALNPTLTNYPDGVVHCIFKGRCPSVQQMKATRDLHAQVLMVVPHSDPSLGQYMQMTADLFAIPAGAPDQLVWDGRKFSSHGSFTVTGEHGYFSTTTWNITGELSENGCEVLRIDGSETQTSNLGTNERQLSLINVPLYNLSLEQPAGGVHYYIYGDAVRSSVVSAKNAYHPAPGQNAYNYELANAVELLAVKVEFQKQNTKAGN